MALLQVIYELLSVDFMFVSIAFSGFLVAIAESICCLLVAWKSVVAVANAPIVLEFILSSADGTPSKFIGLKIFA